MSTWLRRGLVIVLVVTFSKATALLPAGEASPSVNAGGTELWVSRYDGPESKIDYANTVVETPDAILPVGVAAASPFSPGDQLWARLYDGAVFRDWDQANAVTSSPDCSEIFVTGYGRSAMIDDYLTFAYDPSTGAVLWGQRYDGPSHEEDQARAIAVSPDGSKVFVTGNSGYYTDFATVAYDAATGSLLWVARYNGLENSLDWARAIAVSPDGSKVFVTGGSDQNLSQTYDYATVAYDANDGSKLWVRRYDSGDYDWPWAIAASPDSTKVFVTGWVGGYSTTGDYGTVAYDAATGDELWAKRYDGTGHGEDHGQAIVTSPDGSAVYVTGHSTGATSGQDYVTLAYEAATGRRVWLRRFTGPGYQTDDAEAMAISPDGSELFVTGDSRSVIADYATVAYVAATGQRLWVQRYKPPPRKGSEGANAVAVSPDGSNVFVTGRSCGPPTETCDYGTISYDARSGKFRWLAIYAGSGRAGIFDEPTDIAVSHDGSKVFVTGYVHAQIFYLDADWATVAYEA